MFSDFDICSGKLCLTYLLAQILAFDLANVYLRTISDQSSSVSFPSLVQGRGPSRHTESLPIYRVGGEAARLNVYRAQIAQLDIGAESLPNRLEVWCA